MKFYFSILAVLAVLTMSPGLATANAGSRNIHTNPSLTDADKSWNRCTLSPGRTCYYAFSQTDATDAHSDNSAEFTVGAGGADICIITNVAGAEDDDLSVDIYRVVSAATTNGSFKPDADESTLDNETLDCFHAIAGKYWLKTTEDPTSGDGQIGVVSITGSGE